MKYRLKIIPSSTNLKIIKNGIIFIFAEWSGQSLQCFSSLTKVLSLLDENQIRVFVFNSDNFNNVKAINPEFGRFNGWGETFWIKKGKLEYSLTNYTETQKDEILSKTIKLYS